VTESKEWASPNGGIGNFLQAVPAVSSNVGYNHNESASENKTLILHWDGNAWRTVRLSERVRKALQKKMPGDEEGDTELSGQLPAY